MSGCEFHHVQLYVDDMKQLSAYKELESSLCKLARHGSFDPFSGTKRYLENHAKALNERIQQGRKIWVEQICTSNAAEDPEKYVPHGQDIVEQIIVGFGWRITAQHQGKSSRSVLITSMDARGVKIVVTTKASSENGDAGHKRKKPKLEHEMYEHFNSSHIDRFFKAQNGRQGVAVLGFELKNGIAEVFQRYGEKHPKLLLSTKVHSYVDKRSINGNEFELGRMEIFEAFAYYKTDKNSQAYHGTVLRFVQRSGTFGPREGFSNPQGVLPGLEDVTADFDGTSIPAYSDHWVSNVVDRKSFLETLEDVLGFTPKVDFNAGVVAAGQAKIESTVTGNTAKLETSDARKILRNQAQVYLPINNALSEVGHVHGFLREIGQGVQHLASRVKDLVSFVERVNSYRKITGQGFSFLRIPRSYYGRLDLERDLVPLANGNEAVARAWLDALQSKLLVSNTGIVELDIEDDDVLYALQGIDLDHETKVKLIHAVKTARYSNLYKLLRDHLEDRTYVQIVRNQILVDIQGQDILYQIFTSNILQRSPGEEAPFFEFIQRVCSERKDSCGEPLPVKPGCGGFGIRNFLTLFLSIEVSKAMNEMEAKQKAGDEAGMALARKKIELFTAQLDESNPVLTRISDAMTAEGDALDELEKLDDEPSSSKAQALRERAAEMARIKNEGNKELQAISERYAQVFHSIVN